MDTEVLAKRLFELRTLLEKLHQEINLPDFPNNFFESGKDLEAAPNALLKQIACLLHTGDALSQENTFLREKRLLGWLLSAQQPLLDESYQHILLLQEILQHNPAGIAIVSGPDLVFRAATPSYRALLPNPTLPLIGKPYREVWHTEQGVKAEELIRQFLESGKNLAVDHIERGHSEGFLRRYALRMRRFTWSGEKAALLWMQEASQGECSYRASTNIAGESHRQTEELDAISMAMGEAVIIFNTEGQAIRANPAAIEMFGIDPVGLERGELIDLLSLRNSDGSPAQVGDLPSERALQGETITDQQMLLVDSESSERVLRVSAAPLLNDESVSAVVTVWHDVTESERLLEQLEIEQARLETIINSAPDAVIVADEEGRLVFGNPAAENMLGRPIPYGQEVESLCSLQICYTDGTPYDPRNLPLTCSALDGQTLNNVEMLVKLPGGNTRYLLASAAPIIDRKGNLNGAVGMLQDFTQQKLAEETLRQQANRSELMANLSRAFAEAGKKFQELLDTVTRQISQTFDVLCYLNLMSDDKEWYSVASIYAEDPTLMQALQSIARGVRMPILSGLAGQVYNTGQALILTDTPRSQVMDLLPEAYHLLAERYLPDTVNAVLIPLRAHGNWIGTLNLLHLKQGSHFTHADQAFLHDLAEQAALAIEVARLYEQKAQRARELEALHNAAKALLTTIDLKELLAKILDAARQAIPEAEQGVLYLASPDIPSGEILEIRAAFGYYDLNLMHSQMKEHAYQAVREKKSLFLEQITMTLNSNSDGWATECSAIITPLMKLDSESQKVLGVLALFGTRPKLFTENDQRLLESFAATATAALQNATLYAEVQRLATTDAVTDQYNRHKFFELGEKEMYRLHRFHVPLSAIMLDLDNFKVINDTYGHATGDMVLRTVAQRCRADIRLIDILGRYGGDEFAILLPGATQEEAVEIAERIRQAVTNIPILTEHGEVTASISLGVAQASPDMMDLSTLLSRADTALYAAKQGGRNRVMQK